MATKIANWARIDVGVINDHIEKLVQPGIRQHVMLAMMRKNGRITYNHGGKTSDWRIRQRRSTPEPYDDMNPRSFPRINRYRTVELPWRAYSLSEGFSKYEKLASKNKKTQLIDIVGNLLGDMTSDFNEFFHLELYNDGDATATNDRVHGLESMFTTSGSAITNSLCAAPSDTYGLVSTALGNFGGDWTPDSSNGYPTGEGDLLYNFFSPLIVNYTNTGWTAQTSTWSFTWREVLRYADTYMQQLNSTSPDIFLMTAEMLRQCKDSLEDKERLLIKSDSPVVELGFKAVQWEGIDMLAEYGCPSGACYGLPWKRMELRSMQSKLFMSESDHDITDLTNKLALDAWCNMRFTSPAYFCKLQAGNGN
ncbi:hypothetical protein LCGC14_1541330 [marine sediment metagenome]|uniref:Bacteriophage Mu GpT domain-containing protein n=1 Tax=marine sediment metagenome TaxID=412755 RepID=A0A0F9ISY9_9ZZZZ